MTIKVYGLMSDLMASGFYRLGYPLTELIKQYPDEFTTSANTIISPWYEQTANIIIGQRISEEKQAQQWLTFSQETKDRKLICEWDDDPFTVDQSNEIGKDHYRQQKIQDNIKRCLEVSNMITVTTEPLAKVMKQYNDNVVVLPNFINEELLSIDSRPPDLDKIIIGYGASASHEMDFAVASHAMNKIMKRHKSVWFQFIGNFFPFGVYDQRVLFRDWYQDISEYYVNARFDIGIAPIRNAKFNLSKSRIKMLEYAALGIPAICSDAPLYQDFVRHGETGFLADTTEDWFNHLNSLVQQPELRARIGGHAREYAKDFTYQKNVHLWRDAYKKVLEL